VDTGTTPGLLSLGSTTISGGTITNSGSITTTTAGGAIDNATVNNSSGTLSTGGTFTLDDATINGGTLTGNPGSHGVYVVDGGDTLTLNGVTAMGGTGMGVVENSGIITLEYGLTIAGSSFTLELTNAGTVSLNGQTITGTAGETFENNGNTIVGAGKIGDGSGNLTLDNASGTIESTGNGLTLSLDTGATILNAGLLEAGNNSTLLAVDSISGSGQLKIGNQATLKLDGSDAGEQITFLGNSGTGTSAGTLTLNDTSVSGANATIDATSSTKGTFTINGAGNVEAASGDAIDFTSTGGSSGMGAGAALSVSLSGTITGADAGINVTQEGIGNINIQASGAVTGDDGSGITAIVHSGGAGGNISVSTGDVTGTGTGSIGIDAEIDDASGGNVTISQTGSVTGGQYGILASTGGEGDISVTAGGGASTLTSGGSGIVAVNGDTGVFAGTGNTIGVTAYGTITSGSLLNSNGSQEAGIDAGYLGAGAIGSVTVEDYASIYAGAGDGIDALFNGTGAGAVTVIDEAGTTITANSASTGANNNDNAPDGIAAINRGTGDISVTVMSSNDIINGGSAGILAVNQASAIAPTAGSSVLVTARGTITAGNVDTNQGDAPAGILAGYEGGTTDTVNASVTGAVTISNYANITSSDGDGIRGFDYGFGSVTINNEASTTVSGKEGIRTITEQSGDTIAITNNGTVQGLGDVKTDAVIRITQSGGSATVTNTGTIEATTSLPSAIAIFESGGTLSVTNTGTIVGGVTADAAIDNQTGGIWDVSGTNSFSGATTVTNAGTINIEGQTSFTSSGTLTFTNTGTINVVSAGFAISSLTNTGHINFNGLGETLQSVVIDNTDGGIVVTAGAGLTLDGGIKISGGAITVDGAAATPPPSAALLSLSSANTLTNVDVSNAGGSLHNSGTLTLDGTDTLSGGLNNTGTITVAGTFDLANGMLTAGGTIADNGSIDSNGTSVIDKAAITGGNLTVESGTLTLGSANTLTNVDVSNAGGSLHNSGTLTLDGTDTLSGDLNNTGTITVAGTLDLNNGSTITIATGATLDLTSGTLSGGGTITSSGTIDTTGTSAMDNADLTGGDLTVTSGTLTLNNANINGVTVFNYGSIEAIGSDKISSSIDNEGTLTAENGAILNLASAVTGGGSIVIDAGGSVEIGGYNTQTVNFAAAGTLQINGSANDSGTVGNFASGDTIDLAGITYSSTNETDVWLQNGGSGTLQIYSVATLEYSINLAGVYAPNDFALAGDTGGTSGGTDIIWNTTTIIAPDAGGTASGFATIDNPGTTGNYTGGINDSGVIVGSSADDSGGWTGWEYNGVFSTIGIAGSFYNNTTAINDLDQISGFNSPSSPTPRYGFIDTGGSYAQLSLSPYSTTDYDINDSGVIVGGIYLHTVSGVTPIYTGFVDNNGTITYLNAPGSLNSNGYTYPSGINDADQVVGTFETSYGGNQQGFLYQNGNYTSINDPSAGAEGTDATDINNSGVIVGFYYDSSDKLNGFVDIGGTFTTIDDPLGVEGTQVYGINNAGQIVGSYIDGSGVEHGFVASLNGVTTNEDAALTLSSLNVSAADAGSNPIEVTLAVGDGVLSLGTEAGVTETAVGTDDVTLNGAQSAIDAALAAGLTYTPTLDYHFADVLVITVNDEGYNVTGMAQTTTQDVGIIIAPADTIAESGIYTVPDASTATIAFAGANGTLVLDSPSAFSGLIADISGNGDVIDLSGLSNADTATTGSGSFNPVTDTTLLTVYDSSHDVLATLNLAGNYSSSIWSVTPDGSGGADIADPPAASAAEPSVLSTATANGASGSISFADADPASTISASVTPEGSNYIGSFSLDQPTASNGTVSVGFDFMANNDQLNLTPGETLTQSYSVSVADAQNPAENVNQTVSVTVGGPGNDNFVFAPGIGADTITNFNPQQDTLELDHFANVQTVQELQSLVTTDAHGDAVINLGHNDSITLANVTAPQLQQVILAGHVLMH
jgi:probable HAF family extracellular repeat protein